MASTTALYSGLSGMNANARRLEVIGNNISNANTTAFKSSRMLFSTQMSNTFSAGTQPGDINGGTNPFQIGLGVQVAATQRDFNGGTISATGDPRDLALDGHGFFIVDHGGTQMYTRAGSFRQNRDNELVDPSGNRVLGYGVDANFNITPGVLGPLSIPIGSLTMAKATQNIRFAGNLRADGTAATLGSSVVLGGTSTAGLGLIPSATVPPNSGDLLETNSLLVEIADPQAATSPLFAAGQSIQIRNAQKGSATIPTQSYDITSSSTVQDLMNFLRDALGLNAAAGANPNGATPGVSLDPASGKLTITGNTGTVNDLDLGSNDIRLLDSSGAFVRDPLSSDKAASATGESVRTTFVSYDSLGDPVVSQVSMVLESKGASGTSWRYFVDSNDNSGPSPNLATGQLQFDTDGQLVTTAPVQVQIGRDGTGAGSPLTLDLNFAQGNDTLTALASQESQLAATYQDGAPLGTLAAFGVGADGVITGSFTNGLTRTLGQVAIASFTNQEGLVGEADNLFRVGADSGNAVVSAPGEFGTGQIVGGALEASNVDLGQEFINMILTSTGYSASSRVIRTADELLQQLMVLGR